MKSWRPNLRMFFIYSEATVLLFLGTLMFGAVKAQTELVFKNSALQSGTAGADGAVYRFPNVTTNVDALVKINTRSAPLVTLENLDLNNTGHNKAFQPQVTYNNGRVQGNADWWMEFQVSFVQANSTSPIVVNGFNVTAIDVDGDGNSLNEYVSFYKPQSYITEYNTLLSVTSVLDVILGQPVSGKKFNGPITNFVDIDTSATRVMVTNNYQNTSSFTLRAGAKTTGISTATDRMYSFWFKGFTYQSPVQSSLPVTLINWNAAYNSGIVTLKWSTIVEQNASHFVVEKSADGIEYTDAAVLMAAGNSEIVQSYSYNDKTLSGKSGIIYYRLRMVDLDGKYKISAVKTVRLGNNDQAKVIAYPNPVKNELRVTIPPQWQGSKVTYQLSDINGKMIKAFTASQASQTETIEISDLQVGTYILKVLQGSEFTTQTIIKLAK